VGANIHDPQDPSTSAAHRWEQSLRNWLAPLAIAAAGYLAFEALSGLVILFLPFGISTQVAVLLHTVIGVVFLIPCCWYLLRHLAEYWQSPISHIVVLGYLAGATVLLCLISGVVLTMQSTFGTRISYLWDNVHIVTTFASLVFVVFHLVPLVLRERRMRTNLAGVFRSAAWAYTKGAMVLALGCSALVAIGVVAYRPPALQQKFPDDYSFQYGPDRPFAPSLARTEGSKAMDSRLLSGSESCGTSGCHSEIVKEWQSSAHRYAAMDAGFQRIQSNMAQQNGPESTRYCGGCHDPISLFSGTKNLFIEPEQLTSLHGYQEGVSCLACHSIRQVDVKGNADYVVAEPARYMFELEYNQDGGETTRFLRDFLIRAYPRKHVSSLSKTFFKAPEYCAACHKQFIDKEINRVGWVQLQNQYDNWRQSHWNQPGHPTKTIECRECHMPLKESADPPDPASGDSQDYNRTANDRKHRSHRFLASNQFMPGVLKLAGAEEQSRLTELWLQGKYEIPEIADKWSAGPVIALEMLAPKEVQPGQELEVKLVITSNKVGHDFPTGPLDIIQAWVELVVQDDKGREVFGTGRVDSHGFIEQGTFMLKAEPVDQSGNLIDRHNLWEMVGVRHRRALFPGFSDTVEFTFFCPEVAQPETRPETREPIAYRLGAPPEGANELQIHTRLRYRKVSQYLLNFMFGADSGLTSPITDLAAVSRVIQVREGKPPS
jgi:Cytochrome c554 and c-prime